MSAGPKLPNKKQGEWGRAWREWTDDYEVIKIDAPIADHAIPEKAILLRETEAAVRAAIRKNPKLLLRIPNIEECMRCRIEDDNDDVRKAAYARLRRSPPLERLTSEEAKRIFPWERAADLFYFDSLLAGELTTYVRDPDAGDILQLNPVSWGEYADDLRSSPREEEYCVAPPKESLIRGEYQPIFLWRHEFEQWFNKTFGAQTRRGRKPGSGSMEAADEEFLVEMDRLIKSGAAKSPEDAARHVAKGARGASFESTMTRLAKRYRKKFSSERN